MGIKLEEIENFAEQFLRFLDENSVDSTQSLDHLLGKKFPITDKSFFSVELRPFNGGTTSYALSYVLGGSGIPIEARINPQEDYIKFMIKANKIALGYSIFGLDKARENYIMSKEFEGHDFEQVREELRSLAVLTK